MGWLKGPGASLCLAIAVVAGTTPLLARASDPVEVEFDPSFLIGRGGRNVDLRRFSEGNVLAPGSYRADVSLNEHPLGSFDVKLTLDRSGHRNIVCIDDALLRRFALDPSKAPESIQYALANGAAATLPSDRSSCRVIGDVAPGATARFDTTEQRLEISIPQIFLSHSARGYVSPDRWDSGITSGLLSYHYSDFRFSSPAYSNAQRFLGLKAGVNIGDYRLRHDGSLISSAEGRQYQSIATNIQRDVTKWLSTLTLGDGNTDGQLFDAYAFRGLQLASDDRMLPDSQRGYAPVIRGEARTNARVSVRQNGTVLYETVVPPGPFAINDLYQVGSGSDLLVTITEADGTQRVLTVPFSPMPQLLREGTHRYALMAGAMRDVGGRSGTLALQGTLQWGLTNSLTAESGLQLTPHYTALLLGGAFVTPVGSFALDTTVSRFDLPRAGMKHGASLRASYSKFVAATGTNFLFAAYRSSTVNYYSLRDAAQIQVMPAGFVTTLTGRSREYASITLNQSLGSSTSVAFTSVAQNYWDRPGRDRSFRLTLSQRITAASVGLSISRDLRTQGGSPSTSVMVTLALPLGSDSTWSSTSQVTYDKTNGIAAQAGVSGTAGEESQYGVYLSESHAATGNATSVGGSYRGSVFTLMGNASRSPGATQTSINIDGGLVVHGGGVTLSNTLGDAVGLVYAPAAVGASVIGSPTSKIDSAGYAVVPYLNSYSLNSVELNMQNASVDAQLDSTIEQAVPRSGAVVLIGFKGHLGRSVLIQARGEDGRALPFSATVLDDTGRAVGLVGQGSRIEANVGADSGRLVVRWGDEPTDQCTLAYHLPPATGGAATFARVEGVCRHAEGEAYSDNRRSSSAH